MNGPARLGLAVKTQAPQPARGVVPRPRLDVQRDLVRTRLLTLVTAPPGYGKTCVGLNWYRAFAGEGARVGWLRLGPEDDDADRFVHLLGLALQRARDVVPGGGDDDAAADWSPGEISIPLQRRIEWLLEALSDRAGADKDIVLFIDDAHELHDPAALQVLSTLLRYAPESLHLVLLGRADLPLTLASLRAQDAVLELDADALRFDLVETEALLRRSRHGRENAAEAAQLHEYTGGWIAALRAVLLTERVQGREGSALPRATAGGRLGRPPIKSMQSLFTELFDQLDPATQVFVEQLSMTRRSCASLARHLSGRADAAAMLDGLQHRQLFVTSLDGGWVEFHPLFSDFVQRRVHARSPQRLAALQRAAASWFAAHGLWAEAIEHALAGDDTAEALTWIEQHAMALVGNGDLLTLLDWERQLRVHLVQSPRRLRLAFAWGLSLAMACDRALALLDGVEAELQAEPAPDGETRARLRDECLALRAVLVATTGDYELSAELAGRVDAGERQPRWVANAVRNVEAASHLHAGRWQHLYGAPPVVGDAGAGTRPGDPMSNDYRLSIYGLAEYRQGHLEDAAQRLEQAMAIGAERGPRGRVLTALPAPTLALVRYEQGRIDDAARINAEHFDVNRRVAPIEGLFAAYLVAARVARVEGQAIRARYLLDEGESIASARGWRRAVVVLRLERMRHCLLDGRVAEARASVEAIESMAQAGSGRPALECRDFDQTARIARGWYELADGQPTRAAESLLVARDRVVRHGLRIEELALSTSLALAQLARGDSDAALRGFVQACRLAVELGALRSMTDQPVPLQPLLQLWKARRQALDGDAGLDPFIDRLVAACAGGAIPRGASSLIETLSPRELDILKLLADGQSNKEIARGLRIAPETVKTHVSKIFGKLGASNRAQAAAMATNA